MPYHGVIIEESLENPVILRGVTILKTSVEPVAEKHQTPWLKHWTLHSVEIPENRAGEVAKNISRAIDRQHVSSWYADFKNESTHYIVFRNRVFKVDRAKKEEYDAAVAYGQQLRIPAHQLDFSPDIVEWQR